MRKALAVLLVLAGLGAIAVALQVGRHEQRRDAQAKTRAAQPAIVIAATDLAADYDANEIAADAKYKGRMLEVTGEVAGIGRDAAGKPRVALVPGIACRFENASDVLTLRVGVPTTLCCLGAGKSLLERCIDDAAQRECVFDAGGGR